MGPLPSAAARTSFGRTGKPPRRACTQTRTIVPSNVSLLKKSGTGIERQPDAECLLARSALCSTQSLGNLRGGGFLFRQRLQFANLGGRPRAPLLCSLSHKSSLSMQANGVPYQGRSKLNRCGWGHEDRSNCPQTRPQKRWSKLTISIVERVLSNLSIMVQFQLCIIVGVVFAHRASKCRACAAPL